MPKGRQHLTLNLPHDRLRRFAEEFLLDCDPTAAAVRCGLPAEYGSLLLGRPEVQLKLRIARNRAQSQTEIYTEAVINRLWQLATADPRELSAVWRVNCHHCHGLDHRYQFSVDGLRTLREKYEAEQRSVPKEHRMAFDDIPDYWGGDGFNPWADPHPGCPECGGKGLPQLWVADMRHLSPEAAALNDGIEMSRDGVMRIKLRDRNWAFQMVAAQYGIAVRGSGREPVPLDPARMSDEQLQLAIEAFRKAGLMEEGEDEGEMADLVDVEAGQ